MCAPLAWDDARWVCRSSVCLPADQKLAIVDNVRGRLLIEVLVNYGELSTGGLFIFCSCLRY
jgi:hypothetical protein